MRKSEAMMAVDFIHNHFIKISLVVILFAALVVGGAVYVASQSYQDYLDKVEKVERK